MITRIDTHNELRMAVIPFGGIAVEPVRVVNLFLVRPAAVKWVDLKVTVGLGRVGVDMPR